jgi:LPS-assembly lipoprotein
MTENRGQRTGDRGQTKNSFFVFCLLFSVFCLLSCGFHPIYGSRDDNTPVAAELNQVAIDGIPEQYGQMLRNGLIDRMYGKGRPQQPKYHLSVGLKSTEGGIGLLPNATTSLTELTLNATYSLKDAQGKVLMSAIAHTVANYDTLQQQYATLAAQQGAYERSINEIADQIVNRVSLYFSEGNTITPPPPPTVPLQIPGLTPGIPP